MAPHPGINILFGQNGSGKTNLLEAVHYCALGRSHRTSQDREVVQKGEIMGACGVQLLKGGVRMNVAVKLTPGESRKKQIFIDRKRAERLSDMMGKLQCVIFSPEDLMMVKEGPSVRRRFMDMLLSQLSPSYFVALQQYHKALEQRNAMLREIKKGTPMDEAMMDAFENAMAQPCQTIIALRKKIMAEISVLAGEKYAAISGREQERFVLTYDCCLQGTEDIPGQMKAMLQKRRSEDVYRATTTFGPHREELLLTLSGREMKLFASQGQIRTAALSMKLAQLEMFRQKTGDAPVLLLDDVMSELDMTRRTRLLEEIKGVQTFITCTDETDLEGCLEKRSYQVSTDMNGNARLKEISRGEEIIKEKVNIEDPDFS